MKKNIVTFFLLLILGSVSAQNTDRRLQQKIQEMVKGLNGDIGVYIKNLRTGKVAAFNADTIFPTASMVKVTILIGIEDKIEKGELD
jgi:beta-lactamase class A